MAELRRVHVLNTLFTPRRRALGATRPWATQQATGRKGVVQIFNNKLCFGDYLLLKCVISAPISYAIPMAVVDEWYKRSMSQIYYPIQILSYGSPSTIHHSA